ncbi:MAG: DUF2202 domain-containing protein [Ignavibacteria bacterium]|nr:DUF2202 domain-containing protein [Ignavibacteria bacterium]
MKKILVLASLAIVMIAAAGLIKSTGAFENNKHNGIISAPYDSFYCRAMDLPKQDISSEERDMLLFMIEEEKMAHDVYSYLYDKWQLRPFSNISRAEKRHIQSIEAILNKYGISNPLKNMNEGEFTNAEIKNLYASLIEQGNKSLLDALKAGAEIEEVDIADLNTAIGKTDNDDLKMVFDNLKRASGNHLRAFMRNIERRGETYVPKHLTETEFNKYLKK